MQFIHTYIHACVCMSIHARVLCVYLLTNLVGGLVPNGAYLVLKIYLRVLISVDRMFTGSSHRRLAGCVGHPMITSRLNHDIINSAQNAVV